MKRVTYMSSFARVLSRAEIEEIGRYSSRRNAADGITGVLLTMGEVFFQIIEGDEVAIDDLYARVLRDDRHTDIICLRTECDCPHRLFPDWSMNVIDLDQDLDQGAGSVVGPVKLLLRRMADAQVIIDRYTQPAISRILAQGRNPLEVPLRTVDRLVLFTDMVAFSAITDRLPVEAVSDLVGTYLEACSVGIVECGGEVTKYLGDGVMAYFDPDGVDDALQACVDIQAELAEIRAGAPAGSPLRLLYSGFGLDLGPVIEGSIGSSVKMDYTIIGAPVNNAARLQALTRTLDAPVLMSRAVADAATRPWEIDDLGEADIGLESPAGVHSLATGAADTQGMRATVAKYLDVVASAGDRAGS